MEYPLSYAVARAKDRWDPNKGTVKYFTIFGTGSLLGGALVYCVGHIHRLLHRTGIVLLTAGTVSLATALYTLNEENYTLFRLREFQASPRPNFYPLLKIYLELKFEKELSFLEVDQIASDFVFYVKVRTFGYDVRANDNIDQATLQYLQREISRLERAKYPERFAGSSSETTSKRKSRRDMVLNRHRYAKPRKTPRGFAMNRPESLAAVLHQNMEVVMNIVVAESASESDAGTSQILAQGDDQIQNSVVGETLLKEPVDLAEKVVGGKCQNAPENDSETSQLRQVEDQKKEASTEESLFEKSAGESPAHLLTKLNKSEQDECCAVEDEIVADTNHSKDSP